MPPGAKTPTGLGFLTVKPGIPLGFFGFFLPIGGIKIGGSCGYRQNKKFVFDLLKGFLTWPVPIKPAATGEFSSTSVATVGIDFPVPSYSEVGLGFPGFPYVLPPSLASSGNLGIL